MKDDDPVSQQESAQLRARVGQLGWLAKPGTPDLAFAVSFLQQASNSLTKLRGTKMCFPQFCQINNGQSWRMKHGSGFVLTKDPLSEPKNPGFDLRGRDRVSQKMLEEHAVTCRFF